MRRTLQLAPLAAVTLVALVGCEASPDPGVAAPEVQATVAGPGPVVASATGSAHRVRADRLFALAFTARRHADGSAGGNYHADFQALGVSFDVDVTCMSVDGNTAWIAGVVRKVDGPVVVPGTVSYFYVVDGGEGHGAVDRVSALAVNEPDGEDTVFCEDQPLLLQNVPIELGNAQVRGG